MYVIIDQKMLNVSCVVILSQYNCWAMLCVIWIHLNYTWAQAIHDIHALELVV